MTMSMVLNILKNLIIYKVTINLHVLIIFNSLQVCSFYKIRILQLHPC